VEGLATKTAYLLVAAPASIKLIYKDKEPGGELSGADCKARRQLTLHKSCGPFGFRCVGCGEPCEGRGGETRPPTEAACTDLALELALLVF
jgi:hypothetical protein